MAVTSKQASSLTTAWVASIAPESRTGELSLPFAGALTDPVAWQSRDPSNTELSAIGADPGNNEEVVALGVIGLKSAESGSVLRRRSARARLHSVAVSAAELHSPLRLNHEPACSQVDFENDIRSESFCLRTAKTAIWPSEQISLPVICPGDCCTFLVETTLLHMRVPEEAESMYIGTEKNTIANRNRLAGIICAIRASDSRNGVISEQTIENISSLEMKVRPCVTFREIRSANQATELALSSMNPVLEAMNM
jgi:hypothetical protein